MKRHTKCRYQIIMVSYKSSNNAHNLVTSMTHIDLRYYYLHLKYYRPQLNTLMNAFRFRSSRLGFVHPPLRSAWRALSVKGNQFSGLNGLQMLLSYSFKCRMKYLESEQHSKWKKNENSHIQQRSPINYCCVRFSSFCCCALVAVCIYRSFAFILALSNM